MTAEGLSSRHPPVTIEMTLSGFTKVRNYQLYGEIMEDVNSSDYNQVNQ